MSLDERLRRGLVAAARRVETDPDGDVAAGRGRVERRRRRARLVTGAAVAVLVVAAAVTATQLGGDDGPSDDPTIVGDEGQAGEHPPSPPPERSVGPAPTAGPGDDHPPPVRVSAGDRSLELDAFTYCYGSVCADGMPPNPLPDIGEAAELHVDFALPDWTFQAELRLAGQDCGRVESVDLEPDGEGGHVLRPAGPAGDYDVTLSGWGDGDAFYAFRWTTTEDGPVAAPTARLAVLADHDGQVDSYGVELALQHLAREPAQADATITVLASEGRSHTFATGSLVDECPDGDVFWSGGMEEGLAAAAMAQAGPFTYEVVLTLDGVEHRATATWPDDIIVGNEPSVALDFSPALPTTPSP